MQEATPESSTLTETLSEFHSADRLFRDFFRRKKLIRRLDRELNESGIVETVGQRRLRLAYMLRGMRGFIEVRSPEARGPAINKPFTIVTDRYQEEN